MSKHAKRRQTSRPKRLDTLSAPGLSQGDAATASRHLLERLLDTPDLALVVPRMAPEALHRLIRQCGLEACGALMASATPSQLASVFDLDLWRHAQPGHDARLDADRFGQWLDVLVDADAATAARIVAAMDPDLVIGGLSQFIRVFDPATFEPTFSSDDEQPMRGTPLTSGSEITVGGYLVRAVSADAWDAILTLLVALEMEHPACFHRVMRGCRRQSNSAPEIDGLDQLLTGPDQLMHDVALDRERRQSSLGYSTPADARAFLDMARQRRTVPDTPPPVNPIVAAYFRVADDEGAAAGEQTTPATGGLLESWATAHAPELRNPVITLLDSNAPPEQARALLGAPKPSTSRLTHIRALLARLDETDATSFLARTRELAFLANTLVAGCPIQDRAFTPEEASDAAVSTCNLGLEHWPAQAGNPSSDRDLITAFELGWSLLHAGACMPAADRLVATLEGLRAVDADIQQELLALRVALARQVRAGTPWRARGALDAIAMLDMAAWVSVLGVIAECPVLPAALVAAIDGRTSAFSASAFEFISTASQLDAIRAFLDRLADILSR